MYVSKQSKFTTENWDFKMIQNHLFLQHEEQLPPIIRTINFDENFKRTESLVYIISKTELFILSFR